MGKKANSGQLAVKQTGKSPSFGFKKSSGLFGVAFYGLGEVAV